MKPIHLAILTVVLGLIATLVWYLQRPVPPPPSPVPVGTPIVEAELVGKATRIELSTREASPAVILQKKGPHWVVDNYHQLPADFNQLTNMVDKLTGATVERFVTKNADRISTLELGQKRITIKGEGEQVLLDLQLGKSASRGNTFVRRAENEGVLEMKGSLWYGTTPSGWAEKKVIATEANKVQEFLISTTDTSPLAVFRDKEGESWKSNSSRDGYILNQQEINNLLNSLLNARFTEAETNLQNQDVKDARSHSLTYTIKTFGGDTYTFTLGRRPEIKAPEKPPAEPSVPPAEDTPEWAKSAENKEATIRAEPDESSAQDTTPKGQPAGPVYGFYTVSNPQSPWAGVLSNIALKFADYLHNSLPLNSEKFWQVDPAKTSSSTTSSEAPVPTNNGTIEVTTPPIQVPPSAPQEQ